MCPDKFENHYQCKLQGYKFKYMVDTSHCTRHPINALLKQVNAMIQLDHVFKFYRRTEGHIKIVLDHASVFNNLGENARFWASTEQANQLQKIDSWNRTAEFLRRVRRSLCGSWPLGFAAGFHHLMTGRDNVKFVARVYGADVHKLYNFVEVFFRTQRTTWMCGKDLFVRHDGPQHLDFQWQSEFNCSLIDEITAVGDARFQMRCQRCL